MAGQSRTRRYLAGLASGYVVTFATIFVGLWLTPFTLRYLDREQFAVFTLASDVLMWLGLLDIGLTAVLNVKAAQLSGNPDQRQLNQLASTTFFGQSMIAGTILVVGLGVAFAFPRFFSLRPELQHDSIVVVCLLVLGSAMAVGAQTFSSLLVAHQQIHMDNTFRLLLIAVRTALTVVLLMQGVGLASLAIAHLAAVVVTAVLAYLRVRRLIPELEIRFGHFSRGMLLDTAGTGSWFALGGLAGIMIMYMDRIVTAKLVSVEMVTTLSLTGRVYTLAWTLVQQLTNTARPALAQILGEGKSGLALLNYQRLVKLSTGLSLLLAAGLWAGNGNFVSWWVGARNYGGSALDGLLALNLVVHAWVLPNRAILVAGLAYVPQNAISRFLEGLLNFSFSIILGRLWGLKGIVLATAAAAVLTTWWYFPILTARFFGVSPMRLVKSDVLRLAGLSVALVPSAWFGRRVADTLPGLWGALGAASATSLVGAICFWFLVLDPATKRRVQRWVAPELAGVR